MIYQVRECAELKAFELAKFNHCTFTVYKTANGRYEVVNGVDQDRANSALARFIGNNQVF